MKVKIGDDLPSALIFFMDNSNLVQKKDIRNFTVSGKTIIFGLPGAFTTVCSVKHLPGFIRLYEDALKKGIQNILCLSVNDPFVMKAWGDKNNVGNKIIMLGDPFCEFTKLMGLETDKSEKGLGIRSSRYTMLVDKGKIKKIIVEKDSGNCEISSAENFLKEI
jgi:peroxiredoxin (alkyl hydroperoxide reductase subunit C)|tara:strand:+ start:155 stop:643 length:489 start_codon:yes stop_codon:yes gene_type:complete